MSMIIAYTDGACKGNGKKTASAGGYGAYITYPNGDTRKIWGGESDTTNNRMELMGAIAALEHTPKDTPLQLWTDSAYVQNGITKWVKGWKAKNWRKADGKPVLNQELWQRLDELAYARTIDWQWIKGHAGHAGNEMADELANLGVNGTGNEFYPVDIHSTNNIYSMDNPTPPSAPNDKSTAQSKKSSRQSKSSQQSTPTPTTPKITEQAQAMTQSTTTNNDFLWHASEQNPAYDGDTTRTNADFWAILPDPINRGRAERQLIMDTETTGFEENNGDRIVEIGIIEMVGRKFTGQKLHVYLNPNKVMNDEVIRVHGISNEFVSDKPSFEAVAHKVYEFMKGAEVIAHNATFDMRFLNMEFGRVGLSDFAEQVSVIDSLAIAKTLYPGQKNSLDALVKRLDVGKKDRTFHGALLDSEILAEVYLSMTGGQVALDMGSDTSDTETHTEHENLSHLLGSLVRSAANLDADSQWRQTVLK
ncbi:MAG: DNA polymerase III subunit epsilon [Moraxella sp.]|nr:DNA polymerase III subunit epsilon [Moraxella sp.]